MKLVKSCFEPCFDCCFECYFELRLKRENVIFEFHLSYLSA